MSILAFRRRAFRPVIKYAKILISYIRLKIIPLSSANLEIGSGSAKRTDWLTLDICKGSDIYWDLRLRLPFAQMSFNKVYCSHVLEHFSFNELMVLLRNVHRILKPGGQFYICVPDASLYIEAYLGKRDAEKMLQYKPAISSSHSMDILNYIFYMDGQHKYMFDAENLAYHCKAAGFRQCETRSFDPVLDQAARDYESLYMLCIK